MLLVVGLDVDVVSMVVEVDVVEEVDDAGSVDTGSVTGTVVGVGVGSSWTPL